MNKKFAIVMALFMALAGCTESIEDDIKENVSIPGCNDEASFNYNESATNVDACLTELALEQAIMDFMMAIDEGPKNANDTIGVTASATSSMDDMASTSTLAFSPSGFAQIVTMTGNIDMGPGMVMPIDIKINQNVMPNPDGTDSTIMHIVHMSADNEFVMHNAVSWSTIVADMLDDDCDDDCDGDNMGEDDMDGDNMGGDDMDGDDMGGDHMDGDHNSNSNHGDHMEMVWRCIDFVNYSLAPSDGNITDVFMSNDLDFSMCGMLVGETNHTFGTGEFTMPEKFATRECMTSSIDQSSECETSVIESNSTGLWNHFYVSEESACDEGSFDSSTNMCLEFLGELSMNDSEAFEVFSQGESITVMYQYNSTTQSGILMVEDDPEHDDDMNGHDDDMGGNDMDMGMPDPVDAKDVLEDFDVTNSTYALAQATDNGYSFTANVTEEYMDEDGSSMNVTTTFTFVIDSSFKVNSVSASNVMETITVTILTDTQVEAYFNTDLSALTTQALPFSVMPMGGNHGDDMDGDDMGGDHMDGDHNSNSNHGDHMEMVWRCIDFVNYSLAPSDGNITDVFMSNDLDFSMCGMLVGETNHTFGTGEFTMPEKFATRECMTSSIDQSSECETSVIESNSTGLWNHFYVSEESACDEGSFDSSTNMCLEFLGELSMNDSEAFEVFSQGESITVMYQYNSTTQSGILMVEDDPEHDDDMNGHDDHGVHNSLDWMISDSNLDLPPIAGDLSDYSAVLSVCDEDMPDSSDEMMDLGGSESSLVCSEFVLIVKLSDAGMDSDIMFHDVDNSGTLTDGDMLHINPNATIGDWTHLRLYSTSADAYSDENPMMTPGFTGALGMLALLGAALLTRRD